MHPVELPANLPETFYRGAGRIAAFRAEAAGSVPTDRPEDWIASTVPRFGTADSGLTVLPDGSAFRAAIDADPYGWLGPAIAAVNAGSPDPSLAVPLVKYLDAGQRLPVHVHPDDGFARSHLGAHHGKTEAWLVLDAEPGATVHLGWRHETTPGEVRDLVERQDVRAMLAAMNEVPVSAGDTVVVPAGTVHAIGAGVFVTEVQQAADFSILLEWTGFLPDAEHAFADLALATALGCVDVAPLGADILDELVIRDGLRRGSTQPVANVLAPAADPFFRAQVLRDGASVPAAYRTLVVLAGAATLRTSAGARTSVRRGMTVAVPFSAGAVEISGDASIAAFGPPAPDETSHAELPGT